MSNATLVYWQDSPSGYWIVYAKEFPYTSANGATKLEAAESLLENLEIIGRMNLDEKDLQAIDRILQERLRPIVADMEARKN